MTVDLTPFLGQANAARNTFANQSAQNTFNRNISTQRAGRQQTDFQRGFSRALPTFSASFGRRGLSGGGVQSGTFGKAMQNYLGDYTRTMGDMRQDQFNEDSQFDMNQARFTADRDTALSDIAARKAQLIASTAQNIAALQPYMGG